MLKQIPTQEYSFTLSEALPLHLIETFNVKDLLPRIRKMQEDKSFKNTLVSEHYRVIPQTYYEFSDVDK